jgi:hypothetical protein
MQAKIEQFIPSIFYRANCMPPTLVIGQAINFEKEPLWNPSDTHVQFSQDTVFILDWDDTIMCSSWLKTLGVELENNKPPDEILQETAKIATAVEGLINKISECGRLFIVTNATDGWVELSCQLFMPSIYYLVLSIPIISAQELYSYKFINPNTWKMMAFRNEILATLFDKGSQTTRHIISIGDGEAEQMAIRSIQPIRIYGPLITKSIRIMPQSTPAELIDQLNKITSVISPLVTHDTHLDLQIGLVDIPVHRKTPHAISVVMKHWLKRRRQAKPKNQGSS